MGSTSKNQQAPVLLLLMIFVVFIGVMQFRGMMKPAPVVQPGDLAEGLDLLSQNPSAPKRVPAQESGVKAVAGAQEKTAALDCAHPPKELKTNSGFVRLKLANCYFKNSKEHGIDIKNKSNGFTAAIFITGEQAHTDYIDVIKGKNTIAVSFQEGKEKKPKSLEFNLIYE